jgi:hypothetical protein
MSKHRFRSLEIAMIRRGVAHRHARRAACELECHHRDLVEQALGRGETAEQAERAAREALGTDAMIIEQYANQVELRSRVHQWRAGFVLTGGSHPGFMRAGLGFDSAGALRELARSLAMTALALVPAACSRYLVMSRRY